MGKRKDVVGERFGRLTIIGEHAERNPLNGRSFLVLTVRCDCGNVKDVRKEKILRGHTMSCGCLQYENRHNLGLLNKKPYGVSAFNECYGAYKKSAERRGYSFKLSKMHFKQIITQPCVYCGESLTQEKKSAGVNSGNFKYTGIDRYDNSKGYVLGNCVPCCKKCNRIKADMSVNEMEQAISKMLSRKDIWLFLKEARSEL